MSDDTRLPFQEESDIAVKRSLKGSLSSRSMFQKNLEDESISAEKFSKAADMVYDNLNDRAALIRDLSKSFMTAIRDKTPPENKGGIAIEFERDVRSRLNSAIYEMNNDVISEEDGVGSQAGIALLSKALFEIRDRINSIEYEINKLSKEISKIKAK